MVGHLLLRDEREKGEGLPLQLVVVVGLFANLDLLHCKVKRPQKASFYPFFSCCQPYFPKIASSFCSKLLQATFNSVLTLDQNQSW